MPKHFENNPREISKKEMAQLKRDLAELGDLSGFVHNLETDEFVGGNQRSEAIPGIISGKLTPTITDTFDPPTAQGTVALGYFEWEGERFSYRAVRWDAKTARRANIRANKAGGWWDFDTLASWDAPELIEWGFDFDTLTDWGRGVSALGNLLGSEEVVDQDADMADNSQAETLREKYGVEYGDLFQVGEHLILCGDSTLWEDVEKVTEGKPVDMVFADPPYGVAIGDKNKFLNSFQPSGRNLENIAGDLMGKDELFDMLVLAFTNVRRAMADCASIYVTAPQGGELGLMMMMMMMMSGLPVKHVLNWIKNAPTFSMGRLDYEYQHEPILYTWKKTHKHYGNGQYNTSTWFIDKPRASPEHPTMKPVELVDNAILNSSEKGMLVFDPFLGSGTTIISCERTGRLGRGIEKDPLHVATALDRLTRAFPDLPLTRHLAGG